MGRRRIVEELTAEEFNILFQMCCDGYDYWIKSLHAMKHKPLPQVKAKRRAVISKLILLLNDRQIIDSNPSG